MTIKTKASRQLQGLDAKKFPPNADSVRSDRAVGLQALPVLQHDVAEGR